MSSPAHRGENPYIGPSPFERGDRRFFGRDREVAELVSLVVAHRVVVLYAASGAGKTSLVNAGLVPVLEQEESFQVLPVARLRPVAAPAGGDERNVYVAGLASNWSREEDGDTEIGASASISEALASWPHTVDAEGFTSPRVVIFDQFEELFSLFPERWRDREELLVQVADALAADPMLRVVFALREDYLAHLEAHASLLPGELRTRLRLERLGPEAAESAIELPLASTRRSFAPGVAAKFASDLRTIRVHGDSGSVEVEGQFVEPVHLQVACRSLWSELPAYVETITEVHLRAFGNVDEVLLRFYDDVVRHAASAGVIKEGRLRDSLQAAFLTAGDTRGTAYRGASRTEGVPNAAIDELENRHLLRAEWRAGARWYELTHDRLIEPIRASNAAFAARAVRRRNRLALIGSAILGLAGAVSLVVALADDDQRAPQCRSCASVGSVELATNVRLGEYLSSRGAPTTGLTARRLRQRGVVTDYVVKVPGGGGGAFRVDAVIEDAKRRNASDVLQGATVVEAGESEGPGRLWLRTPAKAGRYRIKLRIFALASTSGRDPASPSAGRGPGAAPSPTSAVPVDAALSAPFPGVYGSGGPGSAIRFRVRVDPPRSGRVRVIAPKTSCALVARSCSFSVQAGTRLRLRALPRRGFAFAAWGGECGRRPQCAVTAGAVRSLRARFRRLRLRSFASPGAAPPPVAFNPQPAPPPTASGCAVEFGCNPVIEP